MNLINKIREQNSMFGGVIEVNKIHDSSITIHFYDLVLAVNFSTSEKRNDEYLKLRTAFDNGLI